MADAKKKKSSIITQGLVWVNLISKNSQGQDLSVMKADLRHPWNGARGLNGSCTRNFAIDSIHKWMSSLSADDL